MLNTQEIELIHEAVAIARSNNGEIPLVFDKRSTLNRTKIIALKIVVNGEEHQIFKNNFIHNSDYYKKTTEVYDLIRSLWIETTPGDFTE